MVVGTLMVNALVPPPVPSTSSTSAISTAKQSFSITGARNEFRPYGVVPQVLGKVRCTPPYAVKPYTSNKGNDQYLHVSFLISKGITHLSKLRIGETTIQRFGDVEMWVDDGTGAAGTSKLITQDRYEEQLSVLLSYATGWVTRTTQPDTDWISFDLTVPGLIKYDTEKGYPIATTVQLEIQYAPTGTSNWSAELVGSSIFAQSVNLITTDHHLFQEDQDHAETKQWFRVVLHKLSGVGYSIAGSEDAPPEVPDWAYAIASVLISSTGGNEIVDERTNTLITGFVPSLETSMSPYRVNLTAGTLKAELLNLMGKSPDVIRKTLTWPVDRGQYDVRWRRLTGDAAVPNTDGKIDSVYLSAVRSITNRAPVTEPDISRVDLKVKATEKLNGVIDTFNVVAQTVCLDYAVSSDTWVSRRTSNPASLVRYVLQGDSNKRPLTDAEIDLDTFKTWHNYCRAQGFEFNHYVDYQTSVGELVRLICSAGRAAPSDSGDGRFSVIIDKEQTTPRQHFTPANSWGYSGTKVYANWPHAFRTIFDNREKDWQTDEMMVYDDGYSAANATLFERLELVGVDTPAQAWKHGRFHIAQARLRPETHSFYADVENLVCTRGDLIRFQHDVIMVGIGVASRVKKIKHNLVCYSEALSLPPWAASADVTDAAYTCVDGVELSLVDDNSAAVNETVYQDIDVTDYDDLLLRFRVKMGTWDIAAMYINLFGGAAQTSYIKTLTGDVSSGYVTGGTGGLVSELTGVEVEAGVYEYTARLIKTDAANVTLRLWFYAADTTATNIGTTYWGGISVSDYAQSHDYGESEGTAVVSGVEMENEYLTAADTDYGFRFRLNDGTSLVVPVENNGSGYWDSFDFVTPRGTSLASPAVGDLGMFGESDNESIELIIKDIEPGEDFTARLVCLDYAPGIYTSDTGTIPTWSSNITDKVDYKDVFIPTIASITSGESVWIVNRAGVYTPQMMVNLSCGVGAENVITHTDIWYKITDTEGYKIIRVAGKASVVLIPDVLEKTTYSLRARYLFGGGIGLWSELVDHTITGRDTRPPDVENFRAMVLNDKTLLEWDAFEPPVIDLSYYKVKYSSATSGATWPGAVDMVLTVPKDAVSVMVPTVSGSYLIKAFDTKDQYSENAAVISSNIARVLGLNVVETVTEDSDFLGTHDGTTVTSGALQLDSATSLADWTSLALVERLRDSFADIGVYAFANGVDLGAKYTSRVTAVMTVSGVNMDDTLAMWERLSDVVSLSGADSDQYGVELYVRTTDDDPTGTPTWSDWQLFVIGDYSCRAFEFKIVLYSFSPSITPSISALSVTVDMPDRVLGADNVTSDAAGTAISFSPAFKATPAIGVTADNMATGDYFTVTSKSATGFTVRFFNSSDTGVSRVFDWLAKGYGEVIA
jgi:hypothetical protein